jgi:thymidine kinase
MPKLYFRYGTMNSSKTANLLMVAHNYVSQGKKVFTIKPSVDDRVSRSMITSRAISGIPADYILSYNDTILPCISPDVKCILVDEAQFLSPANVDALRALTKTFPVICYGLRTDYRAQLFPGSKRLMEIADSIEEIKMVCVRCNSKAIINSKIIDGHIVREGSGDIDIGAEEKYAAMCWSCWVGS